ncbi:MAG: Phenylalanine--tRNA ligase alpha subunit [Chlamydiae bacterium]|nr:Phenylalanine--tRNA ligase alpha subunit [Chlamydiota bacterium]
MKDKLESLRKEFTKEIQAVANSLDVEALEVKYLGKKGPVQQLMKFLKDATPEERPKLGKSINDLKIEFSEKINEKLSAFQNKEWEKQLEEEKIDVTIPGRRRFPGAKHLVNKVLDEVIDILIEMGFSVQYGPEIDTDYYNFKALNFAPNHPAMDMQDTFYITDDVLLRTHTSNIQTRFMEGHKPPIRIIAPGRAYRNEDVNARSHVFFHQVEALYVDKGVNFSDLISTMEKFVQELFDPSIEMKFRPSYFPFVEPGMEVDIRCLVCEGVGCPVCKHTGWLEVAGAGMVHPEVLKNGGIDPEEFSGYAWGMGIERLVMLKYGIKDIRIFTENDQRFLRQFV